MYIRTKVLSKVRKYISTVLYSTCSVQAVHKRTTRDTVQRCTRTCTVELKKISKLYQCVLYTYSTRTVALRVTSCTVHVRVLVRVHVQ